MCLAVQRDIIREIGNNKQFRGKGLLARFLFSNCQHKAGYRNRQKTEISYSIKEEYKKHILELMKKPLEPQMLELSPDAHKAWDDFYEEVEKDMSPGGEMFTIKDWGSKLAGAVARIAGLLHCAKYGDEAVHKPISVTIVDDSVTIGRYYRSHALASFGLMGEDYQIESAKKILEYLLLHKPGSFKGRDVLRHKNIFKNMGEITPGLNLLVERNYIREAKNDSPVSFGRPEAIIYEVNPQVKML